MEQWREQLAITPVFLAGNEAFAVVVNGSFTGFHALRQTPEAWYLEHLWILPEQIGHGFGRRLFMHAAARAAERGAGCLTIEADPHAEGFYRQMGAVRIGTATSTIDGGTRELPVLRFDVRQAVSPRAKGADPC